MSDGQRVGAPSTAELAAKQQMDELADYLIAGAKADSLPKPLSIKSAWLLQSHGLHTEDELAGSYSYEEKIHMYESGRLFQAEFQSSHGCSRPMGTFERKALRQVPWTEKELKSADIKSLDDEGLTHTQGTDLWRTRSSGIHLDIAAEMVFRLRFDAKVLLKLTDEQAVLALTKKLQAADEEYGSQVLNDRESSKRYKRWN